MYSRQLKRYEIFARDMFTCQYCGKSPGGNKLQLAHRIRQGSGSVKVVQDFWSANYKEDITKKKAESIIDHPLNIVTTCSLKCNSKFNVFFNRIEVAKILKKIRKVMDEK
jgi:hypothetical protein